MELNKSKQQYHNHKARAKRKGIPFELTFDQWLKIWLDSGHYYEKGTKRGQYVMSRYKDQGGYTINNVHIQTVGDNTREAFTTSNSDFIKPRRGIENYFYGRKHTESTREKIKAKRATQVFTNETNRKRSEAMKRARAIAGANWAK
jgi:hypothetical protein